MAVTTTARVTRARLWPAGLAWALWALAMLGLAVLVWLDQLLRQTAQPELVVLTPTALAPVLGAVSVGVAPIWWTHERLRAASPRRSSRATYQTAVSSGVPR